MALRLYNTLTRRLEEFHPIEPGRVRMYTCGPTVYEPAHIGNFRTFAWEDLLRRYLRWSGYQVTQVMNLTDVDDRTIGAAVRRRTTLEEVTGPVSEQFFADCRTLGLEEVEHYPRATEHVPQMIDLVQKLMDAGYTYERAGSVYFAIGRDPGYGRLVDIDPQSLRTGGRVEGDEEYSKDDPRDFVLWKGGAREAEGEVAVWDSPWGPGRPGWHLECSAMAMEYLGTSLDIHTGGVDNIFPHHVNEMAQSEAVTGKPFARVWLHAAHLLVDGGKMSKSLGNYHTVTSLVEAGQRPSSIRYLLLSAHYRTHLNFTLSGLRDADRAVDRVHDFRRRLRAVAAEGTSDGTVEPASAGLLDLVESWKAGFGAAMNDDLNVSDALAATFNLVREVNASLDRLGARGGRAEVGAVLGALDDFDRVFGVLSLRDRELAEVDDAFAAWVERKIEERAAARATRDFALSDRIRDELAQRGVALEDTPSGTHWKVNPAVRDGS